MVHLDGDVIWKISGDSRGGAGTELRLYTAINNILISRIVVDVDRHTSKGGDFGRELGEAGIILSDVKAVRMQVIGCAKGKSHTVLFRMRLT